MLRLNGAAATILMGMAGFSSALAQQDRSAALREIRETAIEICYTVQQRGKKTDSQLTGEVHAKVAGVFSKLVDIGAATSGQTGAVEYEGVTQEALGAALTASVSCRERVASKLIDAMLSPPRSGSPPYVPNQPQFDHSFPPNSAPLESACRSLPPNSFDPDRFFDERTRQIMPPANVPRLQQPAIIRVRFQEPNPRPVWTGFWVIVQKSPEGALLSPATVMVMVIVGTEVGFAGFCENGQQFAININGRTIIGRLEGSNDFGGSVSFRDDR